MCVMVKELMGAKFARRSVNANPPRISKRAGTCHEMKRCNDGPSVLVVVAFACGVEKALKGEEARRQKNVRHGARASETKKDRTKGVEIKW